MKFFKTFLVLFLIFFAIFSSTFLFTFKTQFKNLIVLHAEKHGIEPALIFSIIKAESSFNQNAKSNVGAIGLMQIKPSTAIYVLGFDNEQINVDEKIFLQNESKNKFELNIEKQLCNPSFNIKIGVRYLRYLLDKFQNIDTTICAYNAGETIVKSWLNNKEFSDDGVLLKNIPYNETKNYLKKVKFNLLVYKKIVK